TGASSAWPGSPNSTPASAGAAARADRLTALGRSFGRRYAGPWRSSEQEVQEEREVAGRDGGDGDDQGGAAAARHGIVVARDPGRVAEDVEHAILQLQRDDGAPVDPSGATMRTNA